MREGYTSSRSHIWHAVVLVGAGVIAAVSVPSLVTPVRRVGAQSSSPLTIQPSTGRVGIGTSTPGYPLDVTGTVNASAFRGDASQLTNLPVASQWTTNGTAISYRSGRVGIGTSTPSVLLHMAGQAASGNTAVLIDNSAVSGGYNAQLSLRDSARSWSISAGGAAAGIDSNGSLAIRDDTSSAHRVVITSGGKVGIGTVSPTYKLVVSQGDIVGTPATTYASGGTFLGLFSSIGQLPGLPQGTYPVLKTDNDGLYISVAGRYSAYVDPWGTWNSVSDRDKKENFTEIISDDLLQRLRQLPVTRWNFRGQSAAVRHIGPTAQDFHAIFGLNGTEDAMISHTDLSGVALAAVKALLEKVDTDARRIAQLENDIARLKAAIPAAK